MKYIDQLANSIAQRIDDTAKQISRLMMSINDVVARMNTTSDSYRRLAVEFDAPLVWYNSIVIPQTFEEHQRSRRFFEMLSIATFVLSLAYLIIGCYFSLTDDPYYLLLIFIIALIVAALWHSTIRAVAYRVFKLKPERYEESRIRAAEITAAGCAIGGFAGALVFAIGRATGDEVGFFAEYFVESLFVADALLLTASGVAHAVADFYRWSEEHTRRYEKDRRQLFRLKEQISKLVALLSRDLKQFNQIEESARPPVSWPEEVVEVLCDHEAPNDNDDSIGTNQPKVGKAEDKQLPPGDDKEK